MITSREFIEKKNSDYKKGKIIQVKDISRRGCKVFKIDAWTFLQQNNVEEKIFSFERLKLIEVNGENSHPKTQVEDIEYRIGYYIIGKNGNKKDKWTWGQYCPMIPHIDLINLLKKAKEEGVII
jgi:hypothetical protein